MPVKYKFFNEEEVTIEGANSFDLTDDMVVDPDTNYEGIGRYTNLEHPTPETQDRVFRCRLGKSRDTQLSESYEYAKEINELGTIVLNTFDASEGIALIAAHWKVGEAKNAIKDHGTYSNYLRRKAELGGDYRAGTGGSGTGGERFLHYAYTPFWTRWIYQEEKRYISINLRFLDIYPVDFIKEYTLRLFRSGVLVHTKKSYISPQYVEIIGGRECPNDTCPVKCSDMVCCYGSDGISRESFLFSESIYSE